MTTVERSLRIASAEDLRRGLMAPDLEVRLALLAAIREQPEAALALGQWQGRDVVDELLHQAYQRSRHRYWREVVETLARFDGRRVADYFRKLLLNTDREELLDLARRRLSREPDDTSLPLLREILRRDDCLPRARAAAQLLAGRADLTPAEELRIALLTDERAPIGLTTDADATAWARELAGPARNAARRRLEKLGEPAFRMLKQRHDRLDDESRGWFLGWGVAAHPAEAVEPLLRSLEASEPTVRQAALAALPADGPLRELLAGAVERALAASREAPA